MNHSVIEGPLTLEIKRGFNNDAVMGGLDSFILNKINTLSVSNAKKEKIKKLFARYKNTSREERENIIHEALSLLKETKSKPKQEQFISISELHTPVQYMKGIGPHLASVLKNLGIREIIDLLYYFPKGYLDLRHINKIAYLKSGEIVLIKGKIIKTSERMSRIKIFSAVISDGTGYITAVWFNQSYLKNILREGTVVMLSGKAQFMYGKWEMPSPNYEIVQADKETVHSMRIIPVYSLTEGIYQKTLRNKIKKTVDTYAPLIYDYLDQQIINKLNLTSLDKALYNIHFPKNFESLEKSKERLIFDELFELQILLGLRKKEIKSSKGIILNATSKDIEAFQELLPFTLTKAQLKTMNEIIEDFTSEKPMNRLLHGDVGSGKTVVALFALLIAVKNGYQGTIMSPTEVLTQQTFNVAEKIVNKANVKIALLTSGTKKKERKEILENIKTGKINVLIGTHALIQHDVAFKNLAISVVDEQHRFGVLQRSNLKSKAMLPHTLVMSATPIPRTLALTIYGDLDISQIREMPKGRRPVLTKVFIENSSRAYTKLVQELKAGRKGYVVCPLIEESEKSELQSVQEKAEKLKQTYLKDFNIGILHGGLNSAEKNKIMKAFKSGEISVLVSTTVIEVGVDVPDATVMIIEDADHFGLATLHQLRGRVGRGEVQSYCFLITQNNKEQALNRLRVLEKTSNGFEVSEEDLKLRGPGELLGLKQHGLPEFKITSLLREKDIKLLEIAREQAQLTIEGKIQWEKEKKEELIKLLKNKFSEREELIGIA